MIKFIKKNVNDNYILLTSLLLISISPNILILGYGNIRYFVCGFLLLVLLSVNLFTFKIKKSDHIFFLLLLSIFLSGLINFSPKNIIFSFVGIFCIFILNKLSFIELKKLINKICLILGILSLMGLFQVILYYFFDYHNLYSEMVRSIDTVKTGRQVFPSFFNYLGGADSFVSLYGIAAPRFSGYVDQSSAVPAIMVFPAALSVFLNKKISMSAALILVFSIFSMSASLYILYLCSFFIFILLFNKNIHKVLLFFPFTLFLLIFIFFIFFPNSVNYGDNIFGDLIHKDSLGLLDYFNGRSISGIARLSIISNSINTFINHPFFGFPETMSIGFGQLFVSYGQNYGFISFFIIIYITYIILNDIFKVLVINNDFYILFSVSMIYSLFFMFILYNDYAISRLWGLIFFYILYRVTCLFNYEISVS